ncbi:MAG: PGF-pre-PGF domain-containing protein, partial [Candidatus Methanoperedens sp.]|nr:PGF-pre-PGF domain-containing protein [Candidatus Methanoperedens sp.]
LYCIRHLHGNPHVSGLVALILHAAQRNGSTLTPAQVKNILETTSIDLGTSGKDNTYGAGRIDVYAAVATSFDINPPSVVANPTGYPSGNSAARNGTTITLNATITDAISGVKNTGVKNASVNASSINASLGNVTLTNASGFWTNSSVIVNASDGIYYLNVTAYDNVSNVNNSVQLYVTVDNTQPLVYINQTSYQRGSAANNGSVIGFNISANDPLVNSSSAGLKNASVNASLINNTGRIELTNQSGFWRGNATFDKFIADGNYSLNVTFFDYAGNKNDSMQINISIDNTPPSVTDFSVSSQFINVTGFTNISANITSLDAVSQVNQSEVLARVTYPNGTSINYGMNAGGGSLFYYNFTDTAQYGRFNVTILANDTTGNTNSAQRLQFAAAFITNNVSVVLQANNSTVVNAPLSNTTLRLFANNTSAGAINITQSRVNITSQELNITNPGIYVLINASDTIKNNLSYVVISVNYTDAEVSSYVESSLRLYRWNTTSPGWDKLSGAGSYPYVNDAGVDTVNNFVWANITTLSEFAVTGDVYVPPAQQPSSSGGGGGGGGGGGVSGENASNIEVKEKYDLHIFKDKVTSYKFTNKSNPVLFVNITGNISAGEVNVAVEVLKNTSTLVKTPPPGAVYKNINIWVGSSGFATPRNIKNAEIGFMVEKEWASGNEVSLYRYDSEWVKLPTQKIKEDEEFEYYVSSTNKFSPFAITGLKAEAPATFGIAVAETAVVPAQTTPVPTTVAEKGAGLKPTLTITTVILAVITTLLALVYIVMRKRNV